MVFKPYDNVLMGMYYIMYDIMIKYKMFTCINFITVRLFLISTHQKTRYTLLNSIQHSEVSEVKAHTTLKKCD